MKLSQRQYITRSGTHCPVCGKQTVQSDGAEIEDDPNDLHRPSRCTNSKCNATWIEQYTLSGYAEVKDMNGDEISQE